MGYPSNENNSMVGVAPGSEPIGVGSYHMDSELADKISIPVTPWEQAKQMGSTHYKTGDVEPIDLYRAGGYFEHFAICNIIKYAFRLGKRRERDKLKDLDKIIHYATLLRATLKGEK